MPYSVVDFETTGLLPAHHHRVVEVGVTHVSDDGEITGRWETLINPMRDLGPQRIHGIAGKDLLGAPKFEEIAGEFLELLRGRTFVAHNASFDLRFLKAEMHRAGVDLGDDFPAICTMQSARRMGIAGRVTLDECCSVYGINLVQAHSAGADSYATAELLVALLSEQSRVVSFDSLWSVEKVAGSVYSLPTPMGQARDWQPREMSIADEPGFLESIVEPPLEFEADEKEHIYFDALDRCLIDGFVSASERQQLIDLANELALGAEKVNSLNERYFHALVKRAWSDGVLTSEESRLLQHVAEMLSIDVAGWESPAVGGLDDDIDERIATGFTLAPGDLIVLTGTMSTPRSDWETVLATAGFVPQDRITKRTKLLVAADPDSQSGKARQARKYGIPVVGEDWLASNL